MQATGTTALTTTSHPPKVWERHVDDVFSIIRNPNLHDFFQHINSLHPKTKFTMETEQNSQLPFLDTLIQRNSDNTISVRVYRKPTYTDQYLKFTSRHIARAKKSVITSLFDRAKNIINNPSDQEKEENHLTAALQANGYPTKLISNTIRAPQLPRQPANNDNTENPKTAVLCMLIRPDKPPSQTTSYRPISLRSAIIKLFEQVIEKRLQKHLEDNGFFSSLRLQGTQKLSW